VKLGAHRSIGKKLNTRDMSSEGNMRILPLALLITMSVLGGAANADPLPKRVLIVLTNTAQVPGSDRPTGVWASEYTDPYQVFSKAGFEVHVGSPNGGKSPVNPVRIGSES